MSTPAQPPNASVSSPYRRVRSLARIAVGFVAIFLVGLGACAYSVRHSTDEFGGIPGNTSFFVMLFSIVGLIATGIAALARIIRTRYQKD